MTCPYCGGDGTVPVMVNDGTLYYEDREACPDCHGTGEEEARMGTRIRMHTNGDPSVGIPGSDLVLEVSWEDADAVAAAEVLSDYADDRVIVDEVVKTAHDDLYMLVFAAKEALKEMDRVTRKFEPERWNERLAVVSSLWVALERMGEDDPR
jgi:hypothetical protein